MSLQHPVVPHPLPPQSRKQERKHHRTTASAHPAARPTPDACGALLFMVTVSLGRGHLGYTRARQGAQAARGDSCAPGPTSDTLLYWTPPSWVQGPRTYPLLLRNRPQELLQVFLTLRGERTVSSRSALCPPLANPVGHVMRIYLTGRGGKLCSLASQGEGLSHVTGYFVRNPTQDENASAPD